MSLRKQGVAQWVYPATLARVRDRAAKIQAADPLHRKVTFDQALNYMLDRQDELDKQEHSDD